MYPSEISGQLALRLTFTMRGLVYCQVPPSAVLAATNFLNGTNITATLPTFLTVPFDRHFTQIGDSAHIIDINVAGTAFETRTIIPTLIGFSITRLSCQHMGFGVRPEVMQSIADQLRQDPLVIPAQQLEFVKYAASLSGNSSSFTASISHVFDNAE